MPILWAWGLATALSVVVCLRQRGDSPGLCVLMALLLGPGAIMVNRAGQRRPEGTQALAVVALIGGLSTTMFLLFHSVLLQYAYFFWELSLALPVPLYALLDLERFAKSGALGPTWLLLQSFIPWLVYELAMRLLRTDATDEEELAIQLLRNWARLLPLLALCSAFLSLFAFSLLEPLRQLVGWIGG